MKKKRKSSSNKHQLLSLGDKAIAILFGVIVCVMFAQVVFRYIFNNSLSWSEELIRYLFVWLTFLGGALAINNKTHIAVEFFIELLPVKQMKFIRILNQIVITLFFASIVVIGLFWVYHSRGLQSGALGLPVNIVLYGALPLTSILGVWYCVKRLREEVSELKTTKH
ncbi:MAG: TRAP transporter small permease [Bacteroidales bacterium]|nr:TRAP transporter small permease [Bacteroidales bacterium]